MPINVEPIEPQPDIRKFMGVEIDFEQVLSWWDYADSFNYWLRDHLFKDDDDLREQAVVTEWTVIGVARPNVLVFDVTVLIEDYQ
jgi:hypothetical protein